MNKEDCYDLILNLFEKNEFSLFRLFNIIYNTDVKVNENEEALMKPFFIDKTENKNVKKVVCEMLDAKIIEKIKNDNEWFVKIMKPMFIGENRIIFKKWKVLN